MTKAEGFLMDGKLKYKLVGITIHSGNAHGGHYFSDILIEGEDRTAIKLIVKSF